MPAGIGLAWVSTYHLIVSISKPVLHVEMIRLNSSYSMGVFNLFHPDIKTTKSYKISEIKFFFVKNERKWVKTVILSRLRFFILLYLSQI